MNSSKSNDDSILSAKLNKDTFDNVLPLAHKIDWLIENENRVHALANLYEETDGHEQWKLVAHLIESFTYVSESRFASYKEEIAKQVIVWWGNDPEVTLLLCAISDDEKPDGSQAFIQGLKNAKGFVQNEKIHQNIFFSSIDSLKKFLVKQHQPLPSNSLFRTLMKVINRPTLFLLRFYSQVLAYLNLSVACLAKKEPSLIIVLLDDFIGTGSTVDRTVRDFQSFLVAHHLNFTKVFLCSLAHMEKSKVTYIDALLKDKFIEDFYSPLSLKRGISDFYTHQEQQDKLAIMQALEKSVLANSLKSAGVKQSLSRHSLGFKGSESVFSWADNNIPNNVFPIFWWPKNKLKVQRNTIFRRIM